MLNIEPDARGIKRIQKMLYAFTRRILTNPARYNAMSKQFLLRISRNNKSTFKKLKAGLQPDIIENPNLKRRAQQAVNGFLKHRENQKSQSLFKNK